MVDLNVVEILAVGCNKRFMKVYHKDYGYQWIRISDNMYYWLKDQGVVTSQKRVALKRSVTNLVADL